MEALEGSKMISQLSSEHEIHANLIRAWKRQLQEDGPRVFATNGERKQKEQEAQEAELYEQIGRLKMELEWLKKSCPLCDQCTTHPSGCTLFFSSCGPKIGAHHTGNGYRPSSGQCRLRSQQPHNNLDQLRHLFVAEPVDVEAVGDGVSILHHVGQIVVVFARDDAVHDRHIEDVCRRGDARDGDFCGLNQIPDRCLASRPDQQIGGLTRTLLKNGLRLGKTLADLLFGKRLRTLGRLQLLRFAHQQQVIAPARLLIQNFGQFIQLRRQRQRRSGLYFDHPHIAIFARNKIGAEARQELQRAVFLHFIAPAAVLGRCLGDKFLFQNFNVFNQDTTSWSGASSTTIWTNCLDRPRARCKTGERFWV
ncbi:MAG: hypothetical protein F4X14_20330 [Caldilineaceae bacterium SB0661_bin_32]|uniref:Transposase n=1 Tax=Caldilineaceae bacterium SB0661_bin_32 TaxID=2605255 RepID=A0A6B1DB78_9CHLR|nr:hypothetical protein [Caldilineaceae bacterium SB0661_bin_32]